MMRLNKKWTITGLLVVMIVAGVAATEKKSRDNTYTNLRVLPKNIPSKELMHIMVDEFNDGLGAGCNFCHAESADGSHPPDYASDEKPEKRIAREMIRMTLRLNRKFFKTGHAPLGSHAMAVTCNTCHHGKPFPDQ